MALFCLGVAGSMAIVSLAVAQIVADSDDAADEPLPAVKATEAARPTPTAVPSSACAQDAEVCSTVADARTNLRAGDGQGLLADARGFELECPPDSEQSKVRTVCSEVAAGTRVRGLTVASAAKPVDAYDADRFKSEVGQWLANLADSADILSIGCSAADVQSRGSCDQLFAITVGRRQPSPSGDTVVLLVYQRETPGQGPSLIAAFREFAEGAPVRGGPMGFGMLVGDFPDYMYFTPLAAER